jgi:hypothetical protein
LEKSSVSALDRVVLLDIPHMHMLIPLFEMIYVQDLGELWYYNENGNYVATYFSRRGAC